ncbi:MAG: hypothetical protein LC790_13650 [Actinobacteria bacterium]|nr:hypothetical protein [Actinomycetota bacterium]MCA1699881.1 hypothetical protein [Actinomycetota bacterium]
MKILEDALATVDEARAYQLEDVLIVRVSGVKPTACHLVTLEQSLLDVEPPAFLARLSIDPRLRCTPAPAQFEEARAFRVGTLRPAIVVHHAGDELTVEVQELKLPLEAAGAPARSVLDDLNREPHEAVGRSRDYDLGEAMRDAISQLPVQGAGIPDWLSTYSVVSIGAEIGGIAGFNHLTVRVSG